MDEVERKFLETQSIKPLIWLRNIDDIFFYLDSWWTGTRKIFKGFTPNLSFTYKASKNFIPFWDLKVKLRDGKLETDLYMKPTDGH